MTPLPENPLVSVVIPTYGRPQFLEETIASVTGQTYRNTEIIVVDDCSPEPVTLAGGYGIDVTLLRHRRNMGAASTRNTGIAHASGDLLTFLDDDDTFALDRIERGVREIGDAHMHAVRTTADDLVFEGDMRQTLHHDKCPFVHQVMYRTEDVLYFDSTMRAVEDDEWWVRMQDRAIFVWSDPVGMYYRVHDEPRIHERPELRYRCRKSIVDRYSHTMDRRTRCRFLNRTSAAAVESRHRVAGAWFSALAFLAIPNILSGEAPRQ